MTAGAAAVIREIQQISINGDKWVPSELKTLQSHTAFDSTPFQTCSLGVHLDFLKNSQPFAIFNTSVGSN